jgi:hypothetical protein
MGDRNPPDRTWADLQPLGANTMYTSGWLRCGVPA